MAKVTGLNLRAIQSLRKVFTFSSYRGIPIIKGHVPPRGAPVTDPHKRTCGRFAATQALIKTLDASVIDDFRYMMRESDLTWKDALTSLIMKSWYQTNMRPAVLKNIEYTYADPTVTASVEYTNAYAEPGFGYSNLPWGSSPYGTPPEMQSLGSFAAHIKSEVTLDKEFPGPSEEGGTGSRRGFGCKKPPIFAPTAAPIDIWTTKDALELVVEVLSADTKDVLADNTNYETAVQNCINSFNAAPWTPSGLGTSPGIQFSSHELDPGVYRVQMFASRTTYRITYAGTIDPDKWNQGKNVGLPLPWTEIDAIPSWNLRLISAYADTIIPVGQTPFITPKPSSYAATSEITITSTIPETLSIPYADQVLIKAINHPPNTTWNWQDRIYDSPYDYDPSPELPNTQELKQVDGTYPVISPIKKFEA